MWSANADRTAAGWRPSCGGLALTGVSLPDYLISRSYEAEQTTLFRGKFREICLNFVCEKGSEVSDGPRREKNPENQENNVLKN